MEVESTTAVETPGEVLPPHERPEEDLPAADPAETVAPSVQEPEASTEEADEVDFEGDAPQAVPSTPVSAGKSSEKREAPPRLDPETAKRRKLREQLRRNAELLRELDALRRTSAKPEPTVAEHRLASKLLDGLTTAATYFKPKVANLNTEPLATFTTTARGMNLIPLQRDFEAKLDPRAGGAYVQEGCVVAPAEEGRPLPLPGFTMAGLAAMRAAGEGYVVYH